MVYNT